MQPVITVENLVKIFGNQTALNHVDFTIPKGEIFGFLGPSGSGKTTTIKILTDQLTPTSGKAEVFGTPSHALRKEGLHHKIGILTDNSGLYERLSIFDNLKLYCDLYHLPFKRIKEVLEIVNLGNDQKKIVSKLSKGMLQRTLLARSFLHKPELLFLDEPTSALDPANSWHIYQGLREMNREGTTIFLTTHDMQEAELLCNRVAFLHQGNIQLLDTPRNIQKQHADHTITLELINGETLTVANTPTNAKSICQYMTDGQVESIHSNEPSLGDIFVTITGRKLT